MLSIGLFAGFLGLGGAFCSYSGIYIGNIEYSMAYGISLSCAWFLHTVGRKHLALIPSSVCVFFTGDIFLKFFIDGCCLMQYWKFVSATSILFVWSLDAFGIVGYRNIDKCEGDA